MSAQWPTSVATDSNLYIAVNELQNNLASGINSAVTTLTLNSTTSFPTVGCVLIDNEVIKYAGVSGATLTGCTRAFDGTTAASHTSGAVVSFAIVADHHNVLKDEIKAIETYLSNNLGTGAQPLATGHLALASNASGKIVETSTTDTELGYVHGVTSALQTQLGTKASTDLSNVASVSANVPMNSKKFTGLAAGTTNGDSVRFEQIPVVTALSIQRFTTGSGTYTTPTSPAPKYIIVRMVGGGGGGSGSSTVSAGNGGDGGNTTFGATAVAGKGSGGVFGTVNGGSGGTATPDGTTIVAASGGTGSGGQEPSASAQLLSGGAGASSYFGGSGGGGGGGGTGRGATTGSGGGGASIAGASAGASGSGGGAGAYLEILFTSPAATYAYAVGAGGTAGTTGTGGSAGGAGGEGLIIVEEHYQ